EERRALIAPGVQQANNVWMFQLLEDKGLALEAGQGSFVARQSDRDHLESVLPAVLVVPGAVNRAHGAATEFLLQQEWANLLSDLHGPSPRTRRLLRPW